MATPKEEPKEQEVTSTEKPKPVFTKHEDSLRYLAIAEKHSAWVLKEGNPKDTVFVPMSVVPMVAGLSLDRGEKIDRFYVSKQVRNSATGKHVPSSEPDGAFFIVCEEFVAKYKLAD